MIYTAGQLGVHSKTLPGVVVGITIQLPVRKTLVQIDFPD